METKDQDRFAQFEAVVPHESKIANDSDSKRPSTEPQQAEKISSVDAATAELINTEEELSHTILMERADLEAALNLVNKKSSPQKNTPLPASSATQVLSPEECELIRESMSKFNQDANASSVDLPSPTNKSVQITEATESKVSRASRKRQTKGRKAGIFSKKNIVLIFLVFIAAYSGFSLSYSLMSKYSRQQLAKEQTIAQLDSKRERLLQESDTISDEQAALARQEEDLSNQVQELEKRRSNKDLSENLIDTITLKDWKEREQLSSLQEKLQATKDKLTQAQEKLDKVQGFVAEVDKLKEKASDIGTSNNIIQRIFLKIDDLWDSISK